MSRSGGSGTESPVVAGRAGSLWGGVARSASGTESRDRRAAFPQAERAVPLDELLLDLAGPELAAMTAYLDGLREAGWSNLDARHHARDVLSLPADRRGHALAAIADVLAGVDVERVATHVSHTFLLSIEERRQARAALAREVEYQEARHPRGRAKPALPDLPSVAALLAQVPAAEQARVRAFVDDFFLAGLDEEAIARAVAQHLGLLPDVAAYAWRHRIRGPRASYFTTRRAEVLAYVAEEGGRTCELARRLKLSWEQTYHALVGLAERGLVERQERLDAEGRPTKVWSITPKGVTRLEQIPEVGEAKAAGRPKGAREIIHLLEDRKEMRGRLLGLGWRYDLVREVMPDYTLAAIKHDLDEVLALGAAGQLRKPAGALLWWRLGRPAREKRTARQLARRFPSDVRWGLVKGVIEAAKDGTRLARIAGMAKKVVPEALRELFLAATREETIDVARRLAYTLAKRARGSEGVFAGDVYQTLHWIHLTPGDTQGEVARPHHGVVEDLGGSRRPPPEEGGRGPRTP